MTRFPVAILAILVLALKSHHTNATYKLCAFPFMERNECRSIEIGNSDVKCVEVTDSVDCSIKLQNGQANFAIFTPEASVLISKEGSTNAQVIGEVRYKSLIEKTESLNMVAIVKEGFSGRFSDLKGSKYCHPGIGMSHHLTDHFLTYFERTVVEQECKSYFSAIEEEIFTLDNFFGPSCRPGFWAKDRHLDAKLKKMYQSMCSLCDFKNKCSNSIHSSSTFESALKCLTTKSANVTYVSYESVKNYFWDRNGDLINNAKEYAYLCPNQTVMPIISPTPCFWGVQPWDYVIAAENVAKDLKTLLPDWLSLQKKGEPEVWQYNLRKLLIGDRKLFTPITSTDPVPIGKYINRGGVDRENNRRECRKFIRWCAIGSVEDEKCRWISNAASTFGLKPPISCVPGDNVFDCLQKISQNRADVISIYSEHGFIARNIFNLTTVVYEDNEIDGKYKILAVLKKNNENIKSFSDLRRKRACFPEYNGLGWISFLRIAKMNDLLGNTAAEDFFSYSCIPGAFQKTHKIGNKDMPPTVCGICGPKNSSEMCSAYFSVKDLNLRAMICLENNGDVAFVNYKSLLSGGDTKTLDELIHPNQFKVVCKNGEIVSGLDNSSIDDNCALATGINSEIVTRQGRSYPETIDTSEFFLNLNHFFGTSGQENVFHMFDKFKGEQKLLFKESTIGLVSANDYLHYDQINSYEELLSAIKDDTENAACYTNLSSKLVIFSLIIAALLINLINI